MANISLTLYINGFIGSVLKSPTQMGSLSINNSVTNISRLGTFKYKTFSNAQSTYGYITREFSSPKSKHIKVCWDFRKHEVFSFLQDVCFFEHHFSNSFSSKYIFARLRVPLILKSVFLCRRFTCGGESTNLIADACNSIPLKTPAQLHSVSVTESGRGSQG